MPKLQKQVFLALPKGAILSFKVFMKTSLCILCHMLKNELKICEEKIIQKNVIFIQKQILKLTKV